MITPRSFWRALLHCLLLCLILSCSGEKKDSSSERLRICSASWIFGKFKLDEACRDFMRENPGVKVAADKYENLDSSYHPLMNSSAQNDYDIFIGASREHVVKYAASGVLKEFGKDFFEGRFKKEDFFPSFLELGSIDGKQFMIPLMGELMSLVVRKDFFRKAGLADKDGNPIPPETWEQLADYARKLTFVDEANRKVYGINIDMGTNMLAYSLYASLQAKHGSIFDSKSFAVDTSSADFKYVLAAWKGLVASGLAPTYTFEDLDAGRESFKAGGLAMLLSAHSRWTEISAILGPDNVGILPIPGAVKNGSLTYIHGIAIPEKSRSKQLAVKFIKQKLLDRDFQAWSMASYGKIPSLIRNYDAGLSPEWKRIFAWVRESTTLPLYGDWLKFNASINQEVKKYILDKQSAEETASRLTATLGSIDKSTGLHY